VAPFKKEYAMLKPDALAKYLENLNQLEGWFQPDAALLFMAYNQFITAQGISGDVLEIGVHHGKSAIGVAALRGADKQFCAIDLFDTLQSLNVSGSGKGSEHEFLTNMASYHGDLGFVRIIRGASSILTPAQLGTGFSFCHIDGGHSAEETYKDLRLCQQITVAGGLIALDDYFHPGFPGVSEGAVKYMLDQPHTLIPLCVGFNKVIFQKAPAPFELNSLFAASFPCIPKTNVTFWGSPAFFFEESLISYFDLAKSTPKSLVQKTDLVAAEIHCDTNQVSAAPGETVVIPVLVANHGNLTLRSGKNPFGLSYHVLSQEGRMMRFDNPRSLFHEALYPRQERLCQLSVVAPDSPGRYQLEIDIVWEGVLWFKDQGLKSVTLDLAVR
jgi:hypothetical protein